MKKLILILSLVTFGNLNAQSTRTCLYEYFCGETCPPCASTAPGLYALLTSPTNTPKIISIEWETPIPSAPSNTWSLYQTNKIENDWRWKSIAGGGYGYYPPIASVPHGKIDGQSQTVFGAYSDHAANLTNSIIATAQSYTTPFSINMTRAWDSTASSVNLTVSINASANFMASGNLRFRLVMVEREIHFATQPGTNGQKDFENVAIKSFPTLQLGTYLSSTWIPGQFQTFTINCPLPTYVRNKSEVAFVGFIQDDGNQKVWQTALCDKVKLLDDAKIVSVQIPETTCGILSASLSIKNIGNNTVNTINIIPYIDGVAQAQQFYWTNLAPDATTPLTFQLPYLTQGKHTFSVSLAKVNGYNRFQPNPLNSFFTFINNFQYQNKPISEEFEGYFPPYKWYVLNVEKKTITWSKTASCGGFMFSTSSAELDLRYIFGQENDLLMPPIDLSGGSNSISFSFDYAYTKLNYYSQNYEDTLRVLFSQDCGQTWNLLYENSGSNLITYNANNSNNLPAYGSEWKNEWFYLNGLNSSNVLMKFVTISGGKGFLHIDNVNLKQSNQVGLSKTDLAPEKIVLFPNPSANYATLMIESERSATAHIRILNALNQLMLEETHFLNSGNNKIEFDLTKLQAGIYQVVIDNGIELACKKLNIIK